LEGYERKLGFIR